MATQRSQTPGGAARQAAAPEGQAAALDRPVAKIAIWTSALQTNRAAFDRATSRLRGLDPHSTRAKALRDDIEILTANMQLFTALKEYSEKKDRRADTEKNGELSSALLPASCCIVPMSNLNRRPAPRRGKSNRRVVVFCSFLKPTATVSKLTPRQTPLLCESLPNRPIALHASSRKA